MHFAQTLSVQAHCLASDADSGRTRLGRVFNVNLVVILLPNEVAVDKVPFSYHLGLSRDHYLGECPYNNTIHVDMAVQLY